jgi:hypothetical protein
VHAIGSQAGGQRPASRPGRPDAFFVALSRAADHSVLWIAVSVLPHSGRPVPGITIRHAARIAACAGEALEVTLDGEIAGALPGAFEVAGNALRVITPLNFVDKDDDIVTERTK